MSDLEKEATKIAIEAAGGRPAKCSGWHAKIFNAAHRAAELGLAKGFALSIEERLIAAADPDRLKLARQLAVDVLGARLVRALPEKRPLLQQRIAQIRAGNGDGLPEVQTAVMAFERAGK